MNTVSNLINLTQNVNNINNITNIIISSSSIESKKGELSSKINCDSLGETNFTNYKQENEISIKIQTAKQNNKENNFTISSFKNNKINISPTPENKVAKRLLYKKAKMDLNIPKKNCSTSTNLNNDRMSIITFEDGIILPTHDFYDEFNKEIILTDYFSRFLAISIAIYEDEINESNLANLKNNSVSKDNLNLIMHMNKSNLFNKELEVYQHMRKKANIDISKNEKHQMSASNIISKPRNFSEMQSGENPLFNRQIQYREFNKKNIPERFKSQKIGIMDYS